MTLGQWERSEHPDRGLGQLKGAAPGRGAPVLAQEVSERNWNNAITAILELQAAYVAGGSTVAIRVNGGTNVGARPRLNLIEGSGIDLTAIDDPTDNEIDVTIDWLGLTARKNSGADVGTRRRINFIEGSNVTITVTDDGAGGELDVTIAAAGGATPSLQTVYADGGDNSVLITTADGPISLANATDATDLLQLSRTFAGAGRSLYVSTGASVTGHALEVTNAGSGDILLDNTGTGSIRLRDGATTVLQVAAAGDLLLTPTSDRPLTAAATGFGAINISTVSNALSLDSSGSVIRLKGNGSTVVLVGSAGECTVTPANGNDFWVNLSGASDCLIDNGGTGSIRLRDGTSDVLVIAAAGAIAVTPTSGQSATVTTAGAGNIILNKAASSSSPGVSMQAQGTDCLYVQGNGAVIAAPLSGSSLSGTAAGGGNVTWGVSGGGVVRLQSSSATRLQVDSNGKVTITPASGQNAEITTAGAGQIVLASTDALKLVAGTELTLTAPGVTEGTRDTLSYSLTSANPSSVLATRLVIVEGDPNGQLAAAPKGSLAIDIFNLRLYLKDANTPSTVWNRVDAGGASLQTVYADGGDNDFNVTTADGAIIIRNSADATDLLQLHRTFAGAGRALDISMGASTTSDALRIDVDGSGYAIDVTSSAAEAVRIQHTGNAGYAFYCSGSGSGIVAQYYVPDSGTAAVALNAQASPNTTATVIRGLGYGSGDLFALFQNPDFTNAVIRAEADRDVTIRGGTFDVLTGGGKNAYLITADRTAGEGNASSGAIQIKAGAPNGSGVQGQLLIETRCVQLDDTPGTPVPITVPLTNKQGQTMGAGDVVVVSTGTDNACAFTTTANDTKVIGPVVIGAAADAVVHVAVGGVASVTVNANSVNIARGDLLATSTTGGRAVKASPATSGVFAKALQAATTDGASIKCLILSG